MGAPQATTSDNKDSAKESTSAAPELSSGTPVSVSAATELSSGTPVPETGGLHLCAVSVSAASETASVTTESASATQESASATQASASAESKADEEVAKWGKPLPI